MPILFRQFYHFCMRHVGIAEKTTSVPVLTTITAYSHLFVVYVCMYVLIKVQISRCKQIIPIKAGQLLMRRMRKKVQSYNSNVTALNP